MSLSVKDGGKPVSRLLLVTYNAPLSARFKQAVRLVPHICQEPVTRHHVIRPATS